MLPPARGTITVARVASRPPRAGTLTVTGAGVARPRPRGARITVPRVRELVPRAGSLAVTPGPERGVGQTEDGLISVRDSVVASIARRAAVEIPDAGAAAPRVLGRELRAPGLGHLGVRETSLEGLPAATAHVDGATAFLGIALSVRYPAPVRRVAADVRERVSTRVEEMTGLTVAEVDITVSALVTDLPRPPRVR